ncbi:uncharacterized protein [Euphorbia lathyris]|uniref:uncharacterized protein n=1 Tax=Euphorbia lathyris TaxID=212925 RepID=UPI003313B2D4
MVTNEAPPQTRLQTMLDLQTKLESHEERFVEFYDSLTGMRNTMDSLGKWMQAMDAKMADLTIQNQTKEGKLNTEGTTSSPEFSQSNEESPEMNTHHKLIDSNIKGGGDNMGLDSHIRPNHFAGSVMAMPKVKIPVFNGVEDPRSWLTQAELYFRVHKTQPTMKLTLAQMCMTGIALTWFSRLMRDDPLLSWETLTAKMQQRFSERRVQNAYEELSTLHQVGTVSEYIEAFEMVTAFIPKTTEDQFLGFFIGGLKEPIRPWVRTLKPQTCDDAMEFARDIKLSCGL